MNGAELAHVLNDACNSATAPPQLFSGANTCRHTYILSAFLGEKSQPTATLAPRFQLRLHSDAMWKHNLRGVYYILLPSISFGRSTSNNITITRVHIALVLTSSPFLCIHAMYRSTLHPVVQKRKRERRKERKKENANSIYMSTSFTEGARNINVQHMAETRLNKEI